MENNKEERHQASMKLNIKQVAEVKIMKQDKHETNEDQHNKNEDQN